MSSLNEHSDIPNEKQIDEVIEVVLSFAALNFNHKAPLLGESDKLDALSQSINMLGDELQSKLNLIKEKETLLKEIHHRVKNNMQIVSSILSLQANVIADEDMAAKFRECKYRINSMALVHEQLYLEENLDSIEFNTYLSSLIYSIEKSYGSDNISLNYRGLDCALFLSVDKTVPLGLIINELVMNSYKHAFQDNASGNINLNVRKIDESLVLELNDNGKGIKDEEEFFGSKSLGLQLVQSLIDQLDAQLDFKAGNPYNITISIPL